MNCQVVRGDTLNKLSQRYGVSVAELARANGIANPDLILAGSTLRIPGHSGQSSFEPAARGGGQPGSGGQPGVKSGLAAGGVPGGVPGAGATLNQLNFPGGAYKCGPTSVAMLADALGLSGGDAAALVQQLSDAFGIDAMGQTPVDTINGMLDRLGIGYQRFSGAGADALAALKAAGKGIINGDSGIGGHYMMVDGYDPATDTFTIKDPNGGVVKQMTSWELSAFVTNNSNGGFIFAAGQ
ncbi:MAG: LysM peptidoglycan-binding domain-containing protein [Myxococcota bacterium]|nr:LysM peptidoglycan-binding domain-containing protein [Myxococcota bacterium]